MSKSFSPDESDFLHAHCLGHKKAREIQLYEIILRTQLRVVTVRGGVGNDGPSEELQRSEAKQFVIAIGNLTQHGVLSVSTWRIDHKDNLPLK